MRSGRIRNEKKLFSSKELSASLRVAVRIYEHEVVEGSAPDVSQLMQDFSSELDTTSVLKALDTLLDLGICKVERVMTKDGENHLINVYTIVR